MAKAKFYVVPMRGESVEAENAATREGMLRALNLASELGPGDRLLTILVPTLGNLKSQSISNLIGSQVTSRLMRGQVVPVSNVQLRAMSFGSKSPLTGHGVLLVAFADKRMISRIWRSASNFSSIVAVPWTLEDLEYCCSLWSPDVLEVLASQDGQGGSAI